VLDDLIPLVYDNLHANLHGYMHHESLDHRLAARSTVECGLYPAAEAQNNLEQLCAFLSIRGKR